MSYGSTSLAAQLARISGGGVRDPRLASRLSQAQTALQAGGSTAPVTSLAEGLARVGQGIVGGYLSNRATEDDRAARTQVAQVMADGGDPRDMLRRLQALGGNFYATEAIGPLAQSLVPPPPAEQPASIREYEFARGQGFQGSYQDWVGAKAEAARPQVNVGPTTVAPNINLPNAAPPRPQIGTIPPGFQAVFDEANGTYRFAPIPGGPAAIDAAKDADKAAGRAEQGARSGSIVLEDIGRFRAMVQNQRWYDPVTGIGGMIAQFVPGSGRADAQALADTIGANIGFDRLQAMREASPTGGALGAVTERELALLQATAGNLSLAQSEQQLLQNLERLDGLYRDIMRKFAAYPNAAQFGITPAEAAPRADAPTIPAPPPGFVIAP